MGEGIGKEFLRRYGKGLDARERANVAKGASDPVEKPVVTEADVDEYIVPAEPRASETITVPQKTGEEWVKTLRETAGITEEEAERKQREALMNLVKKDPRTGQKYE